MIHATLRSSRRVVRRFFVGEKDLLTRQRQPTAPNRTWMSTSKPSSSFSARTVWPPTFRAFVQGIPIRTRSLPYIGQLEIDFGTTMMNFGAITSLSGFVCTDVLYLRSLSILGSACGIVYNMTRVPKQINAVIWGLVFIGVNLGRIVQLMEERQEIQFSVEEADCYHRLFKPHGVEPYVFKKLLKKAKWRTINPGRHLVRAGKPLNHVHILVKGTAVAYDGKGDQQLYNYSSTDNGCIIGATAVVDPGIIGREYPNNIMAEDKVRVLSFETQRLIDFFSQENGADVEAALLHMMYVDLIQSLRRQRQEGATLQRRESAGEGMGRALSDLKQMLSIGLAGGTVDATKRREIREYMEKYRISNAQLKALLHSKEVGRWSWEEWKDGAKLPKTTPKKEGEEARR
jgi:hypothetical protein